MLALCMLLQSSALNCLISRCQQSMLHLCFQLLSPPTSPYLSRYFLSLCPTLQFFSSLLRILSYFSCSAVTSFLRSLPSFKTTYIISCLLAKCYEHLTDTTHILRMLYYYKWHSSHYFFFSEIKVIKLYLNMTWENITMNSGLVCHPTNLPFPILC